jgi:hypothetical protein
MTEVSTGLKYLKIFTLFLILSFYHDLLYFFQSSPYSSYFYFFTLIFLLKFY